MLNLDQLSFFARNGYLQVPDLLDPDDCQDMVEEAWRLLPSSWSRDDPSGWRGCVTDSCHSASVAERRGHVKFQRGRYQPLPAIDRAFGPGSRCAEVVRDMLGPRLAPVRQRGLYLVVPTARSWRPQEPGHHIESHPVQAIALAYLRDVRPGGGGLLVWPGSHRDLYPLMGSKLEYVTSPAFERAYAAWAVRRPIELHGRRGDVVFIHHRLVHAPSRHAAPEIRHAFLCDYLRDDFRELCAQSPGADPWEDWEGVRRVPAQERARAPDATLARRWMARLALPRAVEDHPDRDLVNKADASALARARVPGDHWLVLADTPKGWRDHKLDPRGGNLAERGLRVEVDGRALPSVSRNAFVGRLGAGPGPWRIAVHDAPCPLWMKVVSLRLPFAESRILLADELGAGSHTRLVGGGEPAAPPSDRGDSRHAHRAAPP